MCVELGRPSAALSAPVSCCVRRCYPTPQALDAPSLPTSYVPGNPSTSRHWSRMLCIGFTTEHNGWDEMQYQTQPQNSKRIELKLTISLSRAIFQVNIVINQLHIYAIFPWPGCFILGMHDTDIVDYMSMVPEIIFTL